MDELILLYGRRFNASTCGRVINSAKALRYCQPAAFLRRRFFIGENIMSDEPPRLTEEAIKKEESISKGKMTKEDIKKMVNAPMKDGETPLHFASREGNHEQVHKLLKAGADVNAQDAIGNTPLHIAAGAGNHEIVDTLIKAGADVSKQNHNGETPLHIAPSTSGDDS
jgi:hypothetical protein